MEAAIDLLVMLGPQVTRLAVHVALQVHYTDSTAAYVLATAAGRIEPSLIRIFQSSPNEGCREAVIGLAGELSDEDGLSILRQLASDQNQSVRRLALAALAD
jgi:HEAT repeat protein